MGQKLPPQQMELYRRIDEILFYKWDPIGVSNMNWTRDEYEGYLPQIFKLALANSHPESIAVYLTAISTDNMGLSEAKQHDLKIAKLILEIKEEVGL